MTPVGATSRVSQQLQKGPGGENRLFNSTEHFEDSYHIQGTVLRAVVERGI